MLSMFSGASLVGARPAPGLDASFAPAQHGTMSAQHTSLTITCLAAAGMQTECADRQFVNRRAILALTHFR